MSMIRARADKRLLALLDISSPIIQAPMAGVSTPALAAGVSNAGGLGSLGIGAANAEQARDMIRATRALTARPFNVNVFCHATAKANPRAEAAWLAYLTPCFREFGVAPPASLREIYRSYRDDADARAMLLEERPAVVSFHFGLPPAEHIAALKAAGIVLLATATSLDEARRIEAAGVDGIVAQGVEAGGHRGVFDPDEPDEGLGTLALVRLLVQRTSLPVIAAGGIMDGAGIAAALALGAVAAQLGTAFIACPESSADVLYRDQLAADPPRPTTLTRAISGRAARGLVNRLTEMGEAADAPALPDYPIAYDAAKALSTAAKAHGSAEFAAHWAGQGVALAQALPVTALMAQLQAELRETLAALTNR
ncbi:nitronate monooxygenase [Paludibacterium sp.]|uniref:NAD(P)H-dependent flavin oxidoreductase n=1 Tax=Paludibacterium sp. TaxID=1917523 RepID=UPI0025F84555|nr:nitronate monooxygenase [Paludibacterium sp.]